MKRLLTFLFVILLASPSQAVLLLDGNVPPGCTVSAGTLTCTGFVGSGAGLTSLPASDGNDTEITRLSAAEKANAATPVVGTTGTFSGAITGTTVTASGAVTGTSMEVVRGNYAQCVQMYEATGGGNESIQMCAPIAATDTYKISLPAAKMSAINQSRRCSAITNDNCTEEWFTAISGTLGTTANVLTKASGTGGATAQPSGITEDGTKTDFGALNIQTTGKINGGLDVVGDSDNHTLTATELYGGYIEMTGAGTVIINDNATTKMSFCVFSTGANLVKVRSSKLSDSIILKGGTDLGSGVAAKTAGAAGNMGCFIASSVSDKWRQVSGDTWATE